MRRSFLVPRDAHQRSLSVQRITPKAPANGDMIRSDRIKLDWYPPIDRKQRRVKSPEDAVMVHQERAYTSPIWYTPGTD